MNFFLPCIERHFFARIGSTSVLNWSNAFSNPLAFSTVNLCSTRLRAHRYDRSMLWMALLISLISFVIDGFADTSYCTKVNNGNKYGGECKKLKLHRKIAMEVRITYHCTEDCCNKNCWECFHFELLFWITNEQLYAFEHCLELFIYQTHAIDTMIWVREWEQYCVLLFHCWSYSGNVSFLPV